MRKTFEQVAQEYLTFSLQTFVKADALASMKKLRTEVAELITGIEIGDMSNAREEMADCFQCLIHSAARMGMTIYDVIDEIEKKTEKNKKRKWILTGENNYQHAPDDYDREKSENYDDPNKECIHCGKKQTECLC